MDGVAVLTADASALSHDARIDALVSLRKLVERAEAQQLRILAALAAADTSDKGWVREEVACALTLPPVIAESRLHDATDLAELLPDTFAALGPGGVSAAQARMLIERTRGLAPEVRGVVEARVLPRAAGRTLAEFRRAMNRAVAKADPDGLTRRHRTALADRRVELRPADDGMAQLLALLPADRALTFMATVNAIARGADPRDERTMDQRRADALLELGDPSSATWPAVGSAPADPVNDAAAAALGTDAPAPGPATAESPASPSTAQPPAGGPCRHCHRGGPGGRVRTSVHLLVPLSTLAGLDDQPGELAGYGPVSAEVARRLAAQPGTTWRRILTDPMGTPVDASATYRPSAALCELIIARDVTCRFPGCSRPARLAEFYLIVPWHESHDTSPANMHALCSRHHHLKHEAPGWRVTRDPDTGNTHWRSPTGREYVKPPDHDPPNDDQLP